MAKKKKKFNNPHKVPNEEADELRNLGNEDLLQKLRNFHQNLIYAERAKKSDPEIMRIKEALVEFKEEIKNHPDVVEKEEALKAFKEGLVEEEQARLEEELKNIRQPIADDVTNSRNRFRFCMEELNSRCDMGIFKYTGKQ